MNYVNIFCLPKVDDGIDVNWLIPKETCGDCIKKSQQRKLFDELMLQPSKYLYYIKYYFDDLYPTTKTDNQFYLGVRDSATEVYYAESMRTKSQNFDILQKFICQSKRQPERKLKNLLIILLKNTAPRKVLCRSQVHIIL